MSAKLYLYLFLLVICTRIKRIQLAKITANINAVPPLYSYTSQTFNHTSNRENECGDNGKEPRITLIRAEGDSSHNYVDDTTGHTVIRTNQRTQLRVSGINLSQPRVEIALTSIAGEFGSQCFPHIFNVDLRSENNYTMLAFVTLEFSGTYYLCITDVCEDVHKIYNHQGFEPWITILRRAH